MIKTFIICSFYLLFSTVLITAQNLIPNPGFEEHQGDTVLFWDQPSGEYYHFTCSSSSPFIYAHTGSCFNKICMHYRDNAPNEYLKVKLREPLQKGKNYYMQMYVRLEKVTGNPFLLDSIGWYFSENSSTSVHGNNNEIPQVVFFLDKKDIAERYQWMLLEQHYTAAGTEQYLAIGNFVKQETDSLPSAQVVIPKSVPDDVSEEIIYQPSSAIKYKKRRKRNVSKEDELFRKGIQKKRVAFINNATFHIRCCFDDLYLGLDSSNMDTVKQKYITLKIFFETGKSTLLPDSYEELDRTVLYLKTNPNFKAIIHGHTDNIGKEESNQLLSENRAKAVVSYFVSKGISSSRLSFKGWGSTKPIDDNTTAIGREKNRRVEMELITNP